MQTQEHRHTSARHDLRFLVAAFERFFFSKVGYQWYSVTQKKVQGERTLAINIYLHNKKLTNQSTLSSKWSNAAKME
jgi:hypothetical protein